MEQVKIVRQNQGETNGKYGNGNGESLLTPINSYEQTKIESVNKESENAKQSYTDRLKNILNRKR